MENLSTDVLFHYTKGGISILKKIILEGFRVGYSKEIHPEVFNIIRNEMTAEGPKPIYISGIGPLRHGFFSNYNAINIPMVCFCDIRISQANNHIKTYGNYGIGLKKAWGVKNGLNPVIYISAGSYLSKNYTKKSKTEKLYNEIQKVPGNSYFEEKIYFDNNFFENLEIIDQFGHLYTAEMLYMKCIEAQNFEIGEGFTKIKYYDEREWRFIPENPFIIYEKIRINPSANHQYWEYYHYERWKHLQKNYENLKFDIDDVEFIIVKKESEIEEIEIVLTEIINEEKGRKITPSDYRKVISLEKLKSII